MNAFTSTGQRDSVIISAIQKLGYTICDEPETYTQNAISKLPEMIDAKLAIVVLRRKEAGTTILVPDDINLDYKKLKLIPDPTWNIDSPEKQVARTVLRTLMRSGIQRPDIIQDMVLDIGSPDEPTDSIEPDSIIIMEKITSDDTESSIGAQFGL